MKVKEIFIDAVRVVGRHRKDIGDVTALAESIRINGLIHPITVTEDSTLIAGERRLEAYRLLGRSAIPARIVSDLTGAVERLRIERDENTERKPMTPEELVSLGLALEALERPKALERRDGQLKQGTAGQPRSGRTTGTGKQAETREVVAGALGMSATLYERAKAVVKAAQDADEPAEVQAVAQEALAEMNSGAGTITGGYEKLRAVQPNRQKSIIGDAKKQRHAITKAAAALSGIAMGFSQIDVIHPDITSEEAAQWVDDLSQARRALEVLIKRLKEFSSAQA